MEQLLLVALSFGLGYAIGSLDNLRKNLKRSDQTESTSFVTDTVREQKTQQNRKKITIDETKFVTDISTDNLESKGSSLGVVTQTADNITSAASKLAQLKKMKG